MDARKPRLVLVTARDNGEQILPIGKHEKGCKDRQVAAREPFEEAGLRVAGR